MIKPILIVYIFHLAKSEELLIFKSIVHLEAAI